MRILLSTFGSAGDVFPMIGLGLELQKRGHHVTLATNAHFQSAMETLDFQALGSEEDYRKTIESPVLWHPQRSFAWIFQNLQPLLKALYELQAQYDAGVTTCFGFGALLAQEKLGIPVVTVHLQPSVMWSDVSPPRLAGLAGPRWLQSALYNLGERFVIDKTVLPFLNPWRASLDLPPVKRITRWWHSPRGVVCLFPEWFCPPAPDWPKPLTQCEFPLWNAPGPRATAEGRIVFTPGTANVHARPFFEAADAACLLLGARALFLTPDKAQVPPGSDWLPYAPLHEILPTARAFVHHGGIGSVSQGLAAGVPQLLMPLAHDQFDNAERVKALRAGDSLAVKHFTGLNVAKALRNLKPFSRNAMASGLPAAAQAIEGYISPKR